MAHGPRRFGRYLLFEPFARGGMAEVCFGRVLGAVGFSRVVAIKRTHRHLAKDPDFVSMLVDEGRLAGRIRHPNVVPVLDVVQEPGELLLVMEYVDGAPLGKLWRRTADRASRFPPEVAVAIVGGLLQGLHAAHETKDERGQPLGIVHRDVSPQNVLVGRDGLARVTDFGIALARERLQFTRTEELKGKLEYMSREQLRRERVDRRADVYAASLILWELLTGTRPFSADTDRSVLRRITAGDIPPALSLAQDLPPELDALLARGLSPEAAERFPTALDMAHALERAVTPASQLEVARFVAELAGEDLERRARRVAEIEAWQEDVPAVANAETQVRDVREDDEGPTLVAEVPAEDHTPPRALPAQELFPLRRSRLVWALPALAFLVGGTLLASVALTRLTHSEPPRAPPPPVAKPEPTPTPVATPSAPVPVAPPVAPSAPPPKAKPTYRPPASSCNPPFTVDAQGVRVPKRECFKR